MFSISKIAKSILGCEPEIATEEARKTELHQEKVELYFVCPICWMVGEKSGGFFIKFSCGHDQTDLPAIMGRGDQWFCRDCDSYKDEFFKFGKPSHGSQHYNKEEIISHVKSHKEAKEIRLLGAVVKEESYPSIIGRGWHSRAEIVTSRVWGLHGKFVGDQGLSINKWYAEEILGKILEELPELCQEEQALQQDLQLNLSADGKKLIKERIAELKIRIEIIKKAIPIQ